MNIYYSISNEIPDLINEQHISFLRKYGRVLTENFLGKTIDYDTNMTLLSEADIVILICSYVSIDVVFLLTEAKRKEKPILLCQSKKFKDLSYVKEIIGKYQKFANITYSDKDNFGNKIHKFFNDIYQGSSPYKNHFSSSVKNYLSLTKKKKSIFLCGRVNKRIGTDLSDKYNMAYINAESFEAINILQYKETADRIKQRSSEPDCIANGFILRGSNDFDKNTKALIDVNLIPDLILYLDNKYAPSESFDDFYKSWDNLTTIVRVNANVSYEIGTERMTKTIDYFLYNNFSNVAYYPIYPFENNEPVFYFSILSKNYEKLDLIVKDLFRFDLNFHGYTFINPIRQIELGTDFEKLDIYQKMKSSYRTVKKQDNCFYIGGTLCPKNNKLSPGILEKLFLIIGKYTEPDCNVIVEIYYYPDNEPELKNKNMFLPIYQKYKITKEQVYRVNIEFTISKNTICPMDLKKINFVCKENDFSNGKWIMGENNKEFIYESHTICSSYDSASEILNLQLSLLKKIKNFLELDTSSIKGYIEEIIGLWSFN